MTMRGYYTLEFELLPTDPRTQDMLFCIRVISVFNCRRKNIELFIHIKLDHKAAKKRLGYAFFFSF